MEEEVKGIGKKLEKLVADGEAEQGDLAEDMLKRLKEMPITLEILQKTRIGMSVNAVRKATSKDDVQAIARGLIKSWKKLLDGQGADKQKKSEKPKEEKHPEKSKSPPLPQISRNVAPPLKGDVEVREKCRQMIKNSLKCEARPEFGDSEVLAAQLENAIFEAFGNTDMKYKNRIKSRVMNLRDKKNPDLLIDFIDGNIRPAAFAVMTSEEMASEELKLKRRDIHKAMVKEHQLGTRGEGTRTTQIRCGKCGKFDCSYSQQQTRSADEPMTTFVLCNICGHRWKFE